MALCAELDDEFQSETIANLQPLPGNTEQQHGVMPWLAAGHPMPTQPFVMQLPGLNPAFPAFTPLCMTAGMPLVDVHMYPAAHQPAVEAPLQHTAEQRSSSTSHNSASLASSSISLAPAHTNQGDSSGTCMMVGQRLSSTNKPHVGGFSMAGLGDAAVQIRVKGMRVNGQFQPMSLSKDAACFDETLSKAPCDAAVVPAEQQVPQQPGGSHVVAELAAGSHRDQVVELSTPRVLGSTPLAMPLLGTGL
jgi:hypothetical protein